MSGRPVGQSVVLTNPGATPLRLKVNLAITDPTGKPPVQLELTLAPGASRRVPVVQSQRDGGFTAFTALVTPLDAASRAGKLHVDVVAHEPGTRQDAAGLAKGTLMKTEGERGYRVPPSRLSEHPHYEKELRFVIVLRRAVQRFRADDRAGCLLGWRFAGSRAAISEPVSGESRCVNYAAT